MTDFEKARQLHKLLDKVAESQVLDSFDIEHLRATLPELPKQKTLTELRREVYDVWAGTNGNEWPDEVHGNLETWLIELYDHLKEIEDAKPTHPEFLETEADYEDAPEGTVVAWDYSLPWQKFKSVWVSAPAAGGEDAKGMSSCRRRVLRWGWGE